MEFKSTKSCYQSKLDIKDIGWNKTLPIHHIKLVNIIAQELLLDWKEVITTAADNYWVILYRNKLGE